MSMIIAVWSFVLFKVCVNVMPGGGIHLEILGGGVPLGSPNPDPISDQKM